MRRLWRWWMGPKHGLGDFDGYRHTCKCGHGSVDDWDLKKHLVKEGFPSE